MFRLAGTAAIVRVPTAHAKAMLLESQCIKNGRCWVAFAKPLTAGVHEVWMQDTQEGAAS